MGTNRLIITTDKASADNKQDQTDRRSWPLILKAALVLLAALAVYFLKFANYYPLKENLQYRPGFFGITFSTEYTESLGLDWKETYGAILSELHVKYIRIPVYWDEIEKDQGVYDFSKYDYLLNEGEKHNVKFIISIGRRTPRWPECHSPAWLNNKSTDEAESYTLDTIKAIVERYRNRSSLEYWQVENEPFLSTFGACPPLDKNFLKQEFSLVRSLDQRKIIITGSGEMSLWRQEGAIGDIFGSTLYRVVYNSWFGYLHYPFPTWFYQLKAKFAGLSPDRLMVLELQAEPWVPQGVITDLSTDEINKSLSIDQFKANLQYAINLNFGRTYLWGVEWWYWQKKYGNPEYWNIAAGLFK
jgi:hypothetical protein